MRFIWVCHNMTCRDWCWWSDMGTVAFIVDIWTTYLTPCWNAHACHSLSCNRESCFEVKTRAFPASWSESVSHTVSKFTCADPFLILWKYQHASHSVTSLALHFIVLNLKKVSHTIFDCTSMSRLLCCACQFSRPGGWACPAFHIVASQNMRTHLCRKSAQCEIHGSSFNPWHDKVLISEYESWFVHLILWHTRELYHSVRCIVGISVHEMKRILMWQLACIWAFS